MRRARSKLHSPSGASMVLALLFLLFSTMIGAVILTAASANAGRVSQDRTRQQGYLTVSSAARLIRGELKGRKFTGIESYEFDEGTGLSDTDVHFTHSSARPLSALAGGKAEQVFRLFTDYAPRSYTEPEPTQLTVQADHSVFEGLTATLSMDHDYTITVVFPGTTVGEYPLTLVFPPQVSDITTTTVTTYSVTEEVDGAPTDVTYQKTTCIRTVTVTWDTGLISKGD